MKIDSHYYRAYGSLNYDCAKPRLGWYFDGFCSHCGKTRKFNFKRYGEWRSL